MAIGRFDNATVRALQAELEDALRPLAQRHGLVLESKYVSYSIDRCPVGFVLRTQRADGKSVEQADFELAARRFGLSPDHWGAEFYRHIHGRRETYTVCGINPRSTRYPVLARRADGVVFKFPASVIIASCPLAPPAEVINGD